MEKKMDIPKDKKDKKILTRQIIIETDGTNIHVAKAEVSGNIEFIAILKDVINFVSKR